jgi:hypothetical protein
VPTYSNNRGVIRHCGRLVLLDAGMLLNAKIFHIASAEDDILVDLIRGANLFLWPRLASFCAKGAHILERYGRLVRVNFVKHTNIAIKLSAGAAFGFLKNVVYTEYRSWR